MRSPRRGLAFPLSLLAHGGAFWILARLHPVQPMQPPAPVRATEMTLVSRSTHPPAPAVSESPPRPRMVRRTREEPRAPSQPPGSLAAPTEKPPAAPAETPAPAEATPGVALFPREVIERMATQNGPPSDPTSRRRGDGRPPAEAASRPPDSDEQTARRVQKMLDDAAGVATVESGRVDPAWRDAERQIDSAFHPSAALVSRDSRAQQLLHQLAERTTEPRESIRADPVPGSAGGLDRWITATDETAEAHRRANRPGQWTASEIETVVDEHGELVSAVIVSPSGKHAFDEAALAAVRRGLSRRSVRDRRGRMVARWLVEAGVSTFIPPGTVMQGGTPGLTLFSMTFDETTGKVGVRYPLQKTVSTRVQLRALTPQQ